MSVRVDGDSSARFDVVFLSFDEPNCEHNWLTVRKLFPAAQRIHGIEGISRAHAECARRARTEHFLLIDGDVEVLNSATLDLAAVPAPSANVYVWRSRNPVNGLVSGFGGIKLLRRSAFARGFQGLDVTVHLDGQVVRVPKIASISRFNSSPLTAWRGAFRECAKIAGHVLNNSSSAERARRLATWCTVGVDEPFGEWCLRGARDGREYGARNVRNENALQLINDYRHLCQLFETRYGPVGSGDHSP